METVGALPSPGVIFPTAIIHLFGILSENGIEKQCHFCFEAIEAEEVLAMNTPCCHQGAQCQCFRHLGSIVRGRRDSTLWLLQDIIPGQSTMFFMSGKKSDSEQLMMTNC